MPRSPPHPPSCQPFVAGIRRREVLRAKRQADGKQGFFRRAENGGYRDELGKDESGQTVRRGEPVARRKPPTDQRRGTLFPHSGKNGWGNPPCHASDHPTRRLETASHNAGCPPRDIICPYGQAFKPVPGSRQRPVRARRPDRARRQAPCQGRADARPRARHRRPANTAAPARR
jgi:hypothetical protein